jgi:hypothetical protein
VCLRETKEKEKKKKKIELSRSQTFPLRRNFQTHAVDVQHGHSTLQQKNAIFGVKKK